MGRIKRNLIIEGRKSSNRFTFNLSYPFQERYINFQRLATITPGSSKHHEREKARAIIKVITSFNKEDRIISLLPPPFHRILKRAAVPRENPPLQEVLCCSMLPPERKREREIQRVKDSSRTTELFDRLINIIRIALNRVMVRARGGAFLGEGGRREMIGLKSGLFSTTDFSNE